MTPNQNRILELKQKIEELESQLPAHSMPPSMIQTLEQLEDELAVEIKKLNQEGDSNA
jgi:uncharacterized protein YydD (DUF2326 family)